MNDDIIKRLRDAIAAGPTPGPWVVYDDSNDGKTNRIEIVALGKTVARIYRSVPEEDLPNARLIAAASPDNIAALLDRLDAAERENKSIRDILLRNGFVECDIPACNCGSWHHRYGLPERMREIEFALADAGHERSNDNGHSILRALNALIARLDKAERENERLRAERDEHARWREKLADDLHERESQISEGWAALRASGVQSEKSIADGITFLRFVNLALAADARRYRWLTDDHPRQETRERVHEISSRISVSGKGHTDAAIDAAMAAEKGKG